MEIELGGKMHKMTKLERGWYNYHSGRGLEEGTIPESEQQRRQYAIEDTFEEELPFLTRYLRDPKPKDGNK